MMMLVQIFSKRRHRTAACWPCSGKRAATGRALLLATWWLLLLHHMQQHLQLAPTAASALYLSGQAQSQVGTGAASAASSASSSSSSSSSSSASVVSGSSAASGGASSALVASGSSSVPDFASNPALVQSLNHLVAQQVASGVPSGSLQVSASTASNGAVSLASSGAALNQTGAASSPPAASAAGTVAANAAANSAAGQGNSNQFVIKWIHNDSKNGMAYVSITPVNYTNVHEPRIELRYNSKGPWVSIPESAANNTFVALVLVQDEDTGPSGETSLSIEQGNELGHFKLVSTSTVNTVQVNGAPLSRQLRPEYNLTIVARDHGSPPKSSSTNLVIKLSPSPHGASLAAGAQTASATAAGVGAGAGLGAPYDSLHNAANKPPVADLMYVGTMLVLMFAALVILIIFGCALVQRPQKPLGKHTHTHAHRPHHHHHHHAHPHAHPHQQPAHHATSVHHHRTGSSVSAAGSHKGLVPAPRSSSAINSRIIPPAAGAASQPCTAYCLTSGGFNRTDL